MQKMTLRRGVRSVALVGALAVGVFGVQREPVVSGQEPTVRSWSVSASRYKYSPQRIEVSQNDLVKIELRSEDIAHSMTIDAYRIAKRVSPGQPITFEFRADQPGTFPFYCNLQIEDGCRQMHGELVVKPRH
jgi:heme/copper-type cytochrome/quinol oxidase subunit 2